MYNTITAIAYLVRDPEIKITRNGNTLAVLRVGMASRMAKNPCYMDVEFWGREAEICSQYLKKGREFIVTGEIRMDSWEKEGKRFYKHWIHGDKLAFLPPRDGKQSQDDSQTEGNEENKKEDPISEDAQPQEEGLLQEEGAKIPF